MQELNIEKQLEKIESTWKQLFLDFSQYQDTDVFQMNADDAITEALEADNLTLQNMSGGKYVQGNEKFKQMVNDWQTKLGTVESVLTCWGDVQKKWQALESIFIGSADIRVQLPEDSKRFDGINADFQDLMRSAPEVTGVVDACNLEGRDERLNNLLSQLEMCEKALQVCAGNMFHKLQACWSVCLHRRSRSPGLKQELTRGPTPAGLLGDEANCVPTLLFRRPS